MGKSKEEQIEIREKNQSLGLYDSLNKERNRELLNEVLYEYKTKQEITMEQKLSYLQEKRDKAIALANECGYRPICPSWPKSTPNESGHYLSVLSGFEKRLNNYITKLNEFSKSSKNNLTTN